MIQSLGTLKSTLFITGHFIMKKRDPDTVDDFKILYAFHSHYDSMFAFAFALHIHYEIVDSVNNSIKYKWQELLLPFCRS